jgi:DnaJ-like protein
MGKPLQTQHNKHSGVDLKRCLSCGSTENMDTRKYCSVVCRKKLRHQLNIRTGLLKALNTRYATFYFTDELLVMDVLPLGSGKIYSFLFTRSRDRKPATDFSEMCNILGNAWWGEMKRTNRGYIASQHVLNQASPQAHSTESIRPEVVKIPVVKGSGKSLLYLKLDREDLRSKKLKQVIKSAYRRQARIVHPDMGGDEATFRKIYQAYESLMVWAEEPSFLKRNGFPDKWFYDGNKNRWVQPTPK